jgi:light-regulated signal transduction histidine kinase (bacteriophytochrome)
VAAFLALLETRYRDRFDAEGAKFIQFAMEGAERMQTLIRDLLQYSRIGGQALHLAPTDLNAVADAVEADVSKLALETGAVLRRDPLPTLRNSDTSTGR